MSIGTKHEYNELLNKNAKIHRNKEIVEIEIEIKALFCGFIFQILLAHGASVGTRDKDMLTPLMWACRMDNIQHFELLCQADNKVEEHDGIERDANGRTWMHWSVRRSQPLECLQVIVFIHWLSFFVCIYLLVNYAC